MSALKKNIISHNISLFLENNLLVFFFNYNHMSTEEWRVLKNQFSNIEKVYTLVVKNKIASKIIKINGQKHHINKSVTSLAYTAKQCRQITESDVKGDVRTNQRFTSEAMLEWCQPLTPLVRRDVSSVGTKEAVLKGDNEYSPNINKNNPFENVCTLFQGPTFLIGINSPEQSKQVLDTVKKEKKLIFVGGLYQKKQINHLDLDYLLKIEKGVHANLINTLQYLLYLTPLTTHSANLYYLLKCYQDKRSLLLRSSDKSVTDKSKI